MITPVVKETKVVFGPCRLSYTHVFSKFAPDGDTASGKYMTNVLIPKEEKETIKAIQQAIETAKKSGIVSKWGGKEPKNWICHCVTVTPTKTMTKYMPDIST